MFLEGIIILSGFTIHLNEVYHECFFQGLRAFNIYW